MTAIHIQGLGTYVPTKRITNVDLMSLVDTNDEWIVSRTGTVLVYSHNYPETTFVQEPFYSQLLYSAPRSVPKRSMAASAMTSLSYDTVVIRGL